MVQDVEAGQQGLLGVGVPQDRVGALAGRQLAHGQVRVAQQRHDEHLAAHGIPERPVQPGAVKSTLPSEEVTVALRRSAG